MWVDVIAVTERLATNRTLLQAAELSITGAADALGALGITPEERATKGTIEKIMEGGADELMKE